MLHLLQHTLIISGEPSQSPKASRACMVSSGCSAAVAVTPVTAHTHNVSRNIIANYEHTRSELDAVQLQKPNLSHTHMHAGRHAESGEMGSLQKSKTNAACPPQQDIAQAQQKFKKQHSTTAQMKHNSTNTFCPARASDAHF